MSFARRMNGVANKLLTKFDERKGEKRLALIKKGEKSWDGVLGEYIFTPDAKYFMVGVESTIDAGLVNGTTIQSGDKMLTVHTELVDDQGAPVSITPALQDKVIIDGVQWSIVATPHVDYTGADNIVLLELQVRK
mgnify:CR=1 FL=1